MQNVWCEKHFWVLVSNIFPVFSPLLGILPCSHLFFWRVETGPTKVCLVRHGIRSQSQSHFTNCHNLFMLFNLSNMVFWGRHRRVKHVDFWTCMWFCAVPMSWVTITRQYIAVDCETSGTSGFFSHPSKVAEIQPSNCRNERNKTSWVQLLVDYLLVLDV